MTRVSMLAAAAIGLLFLALPGCLQSRQEYTVQRDTVEGLPSVVATGYLRADAKVEAVDYANRAIALSGKDGVTHIFHVNSEVKRLNEIKPGDIVKLRYNSRMSVRVLKVGEEPSISMTDVMIPRDKSEKPGIECTRTGRIVANVESIDLKTRVVVLKPATGRPITLTASDKLKNLDKVHPGDQVAIHYLEQATIVTE